MKNINKYLNEGFFSNIGGSLSDVKKLLAPILEMNNLNRKKYLNKNIVYDILVKLPEKFGFDIYKYNSSKTEIIKFIKVTKDENDKFWVRYNNKNTDVNYFGHYNTETTAIDVHPFYFAKLPLKVVMTYDGEEVK